VRRFRLLSWLFAAILVLSSAAPAWACPNCKEAVSLQPADASRMAEGYNWSVMFMLVVPFSMIGTGAMLVHRAARKGLLPEM
jgi:hypothetical protein